MNPQAQAAVATLRAAEDALAAYDQKHSGSPTRSETKEFHRLNGAVRDALENPALPRRYRWGWC